MEIKQNYIIGTCDPKQRLIYEGGNELKIKIRMLLFLFIAGIFLLGGCGQAKKPIAPQKTTPGNPSQVTESDKRVMANRFSNIAQEVDGVSKATVVVASADATIGQGNKNLSNTSTGKMVVMVGLTLDANTKASEAKQQTAMNTVKKRILESDKRITDVLVTADPNMVKKINDVAAGLIEGKPVLTYARSAAELGKMMKTKVK